MKKYFSLILCSLFFMSLISCSDDNGGGNVGTQTVTVKITGSANLVITSVVVTTGTGEMKTYADLSVNNWSKDISYEKMIAVAAGGSTSDEADGNMKIQILKGNTVLKESTSEGKILMTTAAY
jgi:hypothetical protein